MKLEHERRATQSSNQQKAGSRWGASKKKPVLHKDKNGQTKKLSEKENAKIMAMGSMGVQKPSSKASQRKQVQAKKQKEVADEYAKYPEVVQFFKDLNLEKYIGKFIENGVEDQETIIELQDEHLQMMKIPLGHKLKILK